MGVETELKPGKDEVSRARTWAEMSRGPRLQPQGTPACRGQAGAGGGQGGTATEGTGNLGEHGQTHGL